MTHDYKAALEYTEKSIKEWEQFSLCDEVVAERMLERLRAIRHALRAIDKLMQEPSDETVQAGEDAGCWKFNQENPVEVFKAMRDEMLKEIENDKQ